MKKIGWSGLVIMFVSLASAQVEVPLAFNYQGVLKHGDGSVVSPPSQNIEFRLYDVATSGSPLWGREVAVLLDTTGLFNVELSDDVGSQISGLGAELATVLSEHADLYLELTVENLAILPRQKLLSVPFAMRAGDVQEAKKDFTCQGSLTVKSGADIEGDLIVHGSINVADSLAIHGNSGIPNSATELRFAAGYSSPDSGRIFIGDGTGWKTHFSSMSGGTSTDVVTIQDNGDIKCKSIEFNNGSADMSHPVQSPVSNVRIVYAHIKGDGSLGSSSDSTLTSSRTDKGRYSIDFDDFGSIPIFSITPSISYTDGGHDYTSGTEAWKITENIATAVESSSSSVVIRTFDCDSFAEDTPFDLIIIGVDSTP